MATLRPEDRIWYVWWNEDNLDHPNTICDPVGIIEHTEMWAPSIAESCKRNREAGFIWTGALKGKSGLWYYYNEDTCERFVTYAVEWGIIPPLGKT